MKLNDGFVSGQDMNGKSTTYTNWQFESKVYVLYAEIIIDPTIPSQE
jgi:hypothetical protein